MNPLKFALLFSPIALAGCIKSIAPKSNASESWRMKAPMAKMITLPQVRVIGTQKTEKGIDIDLEYDLFCAPGLAILTGDLLKQTIEGMPMTDDLVIPLVNKGVGPLDIASHKRQYNEKSQSPKYVILPKDSAVVFDPRRLKSGDNRSDLKASFARCGTSNETGKKIEINTNLPIRILIEDGSEKLKSVSEGTLQILEKKDVEPTLLGQIEFLAESKSKKSPPLYFKVSREDLNTGQFSKQIFDRLQNENANAGVSAAAFGMRWKVSHLRVATPWKTCDSLGAPIHNGRWTQEAIADRMMRKSSSRQSKSSVFVQCNQTQVQTLSTIESSELKKAIWEQIQGKYEASACKVFAFLDRHQNQPSLSDWINFDRICGIDNVKAALNKTEVTPTRLLTTAIEANELKTAAAGMRHLRPYVEYKSIPALSKKMTLKAIALAESNPSEALNILPLGFRGVAFGKRSIKQSTQKALLKKLGEAVDIAIAERLKANTTRALKAHHDFGGILGKAWKQRSVRQIQKAMETKLLIAEKDAADETLQQCRESFPTICTGDWTTVIQSKLKKPQ